MFPICVSALEMPVSTSLMIGQGYYRVFEVFKSHTKVLHPAAWINEGSLVTLCILKCLLLELFNHRF